MATPEQRTAAVALVYNDKASAPRVAAKGNGLVAEAIIQRARAAGIYVHESPALVSLLMRVDLDTHIPSELYTAVAELLVWLYKIEHMHDAQP
ncbi:MAG: EscU/YscU/HrcU family type III secretion system export apparatus switch protein [Burkholderiales bacterium]